MIPEASWKNRCGRVFHMVLSHLVCMAHCCWKAAMQAAVSLAAEAGHRERGQLEPAGQVLANAAVFAPPGVEDEARLEASVCGGMDRHTIPGGTAFDTMEYTHQAVGAARATDRTVRVAASALVGMRAGGTAAVADAHTPPALQSQPRRMGGALRQHNDGMHSR